MKNKNPKSSTPHSSVDFTAAVLGNGTSAPTIPADGKFTPTTGTYPLRANRAKSCTRSGAGVYAITLQDQLPLIKNAWASIVAAGGSPTGDLKGRVTAIDAANRQITVQTTTFAGAATDIGTSDMLIVMIDAQDSMV